CRLRAMKVNQNFSDAKSLYNFINSHKKRIEWQIHRIYRCRNLIVHSARQLSFIDTIVLNLDEYYLNAIQCISEYMKDKNEYREIDDIVFSVGVDYYSSMNLLESMSKTRHDPLSLIDLL
ncbi:MAG: hypothetical protein P1U88_13570, partial [Thalassobaculaceae bacterium]|nr:hypothetical protein [Thalassobaculaceae bacterium]